MTEPISDARRAHAASRLVTVARDLELRMTTASVPVYRASTVLFDTVAEADAMGARATAGERHASSYGTVGTPTTFALMDAVAELEGGASGYRAALMPSGLSAITVPLLAFLKPGDHMLASDSVYGPMRVFAQGMLARWGVETTFYDPLAGQDGRPGIETLMRPNTRLVYLESPGSYTFEIQDVPAICAVARAHGALTMIDTAWTSPLLARPFDWGVDCAVLPLTKYWSGHADVLMGAAVVREALWPTLWPAMRQTGTCVGGDDAWLILRGMRTLEVRMRRHESSALRVAQWLEQRPEVASVLHPALPSHPQHALWRRDFMGSSGLFSFALKQASASQVAALCEGRRYFKIGYSWGGFESLIVPAKIGALRTATPWRGGPLVRVHVGLEDPEDLIEDLAQGFEAMHAAGTR